MFFPALLDSSRVTLRLAHTNAGNGTFNHGHPVFNHGQDVPLTVNMKHVFLLRVDVLLLCLL